MTTQDTTAAWPAGVIARYLTVGGSTVDVVEESLYYVPTPPNQTRAHCNGCDTEETAEWGFSFTAHENGRDQPADFDEDGRYATPKVRAWAQKHAETCRAMPRP